MATRSRRGISTDMRGGSATKLTDLAKKVSSAGDVLLGQGTKYDKNIGEQKNNVISDADQKAARLKELKEQAAHYHTNSLESLYKELKTSPEQGLSSTEATIRLTRYGANEIEQDPPEPWWSIFLAQFNDLLVIMLLVASVVAGALGQVAACIVIFLIVIANAILGTLMEVRASEELAKLQSNNIAECEVIRDGNRVSIPIPELVPGDIVFLELGDNIPADCRLISTKQMQVNEAPLTGEAETVKKDADINKYGVETKSKDNDDEKKDNDEAELTEANMAYKECDVAIGSGVGLVVNTGMNTRMGSIYALLNTADAAMSPLQFKLTELGKKLGIASLLISLVVFTIGVTTGNGADPNSKQSTFLQMLLIAVSLTVAAVPEGLPACVTICLASGMKTMSKKQAEIRNLHSVETLGSASVICTDKTGTLTAGKMTAVRIMFGGRIYHISGAGYNVEGEITPLIEETNKEHEKYTLNADGISSAELDDIKGDDKPYYFPLAIGVLCSNARVEYDEESGKWIAKGNNSERPLVVAAKKAGYTKADLHNRYKRINENPFSSVRKMMSTLVQGDNNHDTKAPFHIFSKHKYIACVKGAPNFILDQCISIIDCQATGKIRNLTDDEKKLILDQIDVMSSKTYRVLAFAYKTYDTLPTDQSSNELEHNLIFAGFVASVDPHRPEVIPAIDKCYSAGIRVVMITGDYVKTAKAIAEAIHLLPKNADSSKAIDCKIVRDYGLQIDALEQKIAATNHAIEKQKLRTELSNLHDQLDKLTAHVDVYARAKPEDKITIVRSFKRQNLVTSMTGDGVNDAPALKEANIGVAMGITGSDVAKNAADMVLKDDNFASIVDAVEEGRAIYANIGKFVYFLLSTNVSEVFLILIASIIGLQSPLVPMQILWLNLATDGMPAIALAVEAIEPGVMNEGPRLLSEPLIEKVMTTGIIIQTICLTSILLFSYMFALNEHVGDWMGKNVNNLDDDSFQLGINKAQTMAILIITFAELLRAYGARSLRQSVFSLGLFSNKYMQYAVGASFIATLIICAWKDLGEAFGIYPISVKMWIYVICISFIPFIVDEITKYIYRQKGFGYRAKIDRSAVSLDIMKVEDHDQDSIADDTQVQIRLHDNNEKKQ